ncbi:hypothetical protein HJG60_011319 [Phyllostomus discolor]|uniref:Uncharacterized protein n=1 Tax=Phyllostomus discolor TaxID=89673 RepID=A0A834A4L2_9CHIR|nr:hypothetical protein HJG60_011319 [Phyllostomus discolor]
MLLAWLLPSFQSLPCFPYVSGTLIAAALVLNPSMGGFVYIIGLCRSLKRTLLRDWQFLLLLQSPLVFTARSYKALFFRCWKLRLHSLAWGWDGLLPRFPSCFLFVFVFLFIFRERRGKEGRKRGRETSVCGSSSMLPTGDLACSPGMCPDWGLNQ